MERKSKCPLCHEECKVEHHPIARGTSSSVLCDVKCKKDGCGEYYLDIDLSVPNEAKGKLELVKEKIKKENQKANADGKRILWVTGEAQKKKSRITCEGLKEGIASGKIIVKSIDEI
jgi:hypothetical protein